MLTDTQRAFMQRMRSAVQIAQAKGAIFNTVAVIAQAALESGWGTSHLATAANNLFGVKATPQQVHAGAALALPTREYYGGRWIRETDYWAEYPSWNEAILAYAVLIGSLPWFHDALAHADLPHGDGDALAWLRGLEETGRPDWATDPHYVAIVSALFPAVQDGLSAT